MWRREVWVSGISKGQVKVLPAVTTPVGVLKAESIHHVLSGIGELCPCHPSVDFGLPYEMQSFVMWHAWFRGEMAEMMWWLQAAGCQA